MTKTYQICHHQIRFSSSKCTKIRFGQAPPGPRWGSYDAPPDPVVGWGGGYELDIPSSFPCPLDARAYGASVLRPPQHKILATPVNTRQAPTTETAMNVSFATTF